MELGVVGLGKMGRALAARAGGRGHAVAGWDLDPAAREQAAAVGVATVATLEALVARLRPPRALWLMVPAGEPVELLLETLRPLLAAGDLVADGGNSQYRDSQRRAAVLGRDGISWLDIGTSGGIRGGEAGFCLMLGGDEAAVARLAPLLDDLATDGRDGWSHLGPSGAGHFVKMVHNGIEYGLMQAYGEGFAILRGRRELDLDLAEVARLWSHGSVVRSWLLDLCREVLAEGGPELPEWSPRVSDSGEGRWTVAEAIELDVAAPVITLALLERLSSRDEKAFSHRLLSGLRDAFGGHGGRGAPEGSQGSSEEAT